MGPVPGRDSPDPQRGRIDDRRAARGSPRCTRKASPMILALTAKWAFVSLTEIWGMISADRKREEGASAGAHDEILGCQPAILADTRAVRLPARELAARRQRGRHPRVSPALAAFGLERAVARRHAVGRASMDHDLRDHR